MSVPESDDGIQAGVEFCVRFLVETGEKVMLVAPASESIGALKRRAREKNALRSPDASSRCPAGSKGLDRLGGLTELCARTSVVVKGTNVNLGDDTPLHRALRIWETVAVVINLCVRTCRQWS